MMKKETTQKPELLAPSGDWECLRAAVANGADAVYFGLTQLNARLRADNFTEKNLPEVMSYLHRHGKKGYITLNVLAFTNELSIVENILKKIYLAGADAVIVQDLGVAWLAKQIVPELPLHISTQMTITSPEGVEFAKKLGAQRVILARELSLREIAKFKDCDMPLEMFIHGALCVAYSGQCLTSETLGQRSANRGECAQACRLPYELIVDGKKKDFGDRKYLLSPQDYMTVHEIPKLMHMASFKIEGRLKSPEYVAAVTRAYRKAIDAAAAGAENSETKKDIYSLEMTFSRGFYSGWLHGVNHQQLVHGRFGKKRGPFVGTIQKIGKNFVEVQSQTPLKLGDGICFDTGEDIDHEQGGRIYEISQKRLYFQRGKINFSKLKVGDRVWKTDDPQLNRELRKTFENTEPASSRPLCLIVRGKADKPMVIVARCGEKEIQVSSKISLQVAQKHSLDDQKLHDQLGRLGNTPFILETLENQLAKNVMLPVSELNRLRREFVEKLLEETPKKLSTKFDLSFVLDEISSQKKEHKEMPSLHILCRSMEQIETTLQLGVKNLYADFEDIRRYKDAVPLACAEDALLYLATPRIQKAGEQGFFKLVENLNPDGVLVQNLGGIDYFQKLQIPIVGDFSLNVANPLSAQLLMNEGLRRLTISYDLNIEQVLDLLEASSTDWFELTIHQHMPMFHMEHCLFAAFLTDGTDHTNCGRPCEKHRLKLRDRVGMEHPVKSDVGCRNTVFHGKAQSGAEYTQSFLGAGLHHFRVELLNENAAQTKMLIEAYQSLLAGNDEPLNHLKIKKQLGVTLGTLAAKS